MNTLLVAVDFSAITPKVIAEAATLAKALSGRVVLITVVIPSVVPADPAALAVLTDAEAINAAAERHATKLLGNAAAELKKSGLATDTICVTGNPATCVLEEAAKLRADYILIGSHGHTAFYDLVVGSTAQLILRRATCPVIVVPPIPAKKHK